MYRLQRSTTTFHSLEKLISSYQHRLPSHGQLPCLLWHPKGGGMAGGGGADTTFHFPCSTCHCRWCLRCWVMASRLSTTGTNPTLAPMSTTVEPGGNLCSRY